MRKKLLLTVISNAIIFALVGQSFHTVTFSGSSGDFNAAEKFSAAANSTDYYITFDATYLYIGAFRTTGTFGSSDALTVFIDTDPNATPTSGNGSTTGPNFNNVTPTLPFSANFTSKVEQSYEETREHTGSWGGDLNIETVFTGSTVRELRLSWSDLGNPDAVYITMWMGYNGGFFSNVPGANMGASGSPTFTDYFGGFGNSAANCIPKDITNNPITASVTNANTVTGAVYGKVTANNGTNYSSGGDFTLASGGSINLDGGSDFDLNHTLTMNQGTAITCANSTSLFDAMGGTVTINGTATLSGQAVSSIDFNDVNLAAGVDFGTFSSSYVSEIHGILSLNSGGFINTNAPAYATNSTLKYNTSGSYGRSQEWNTYSPYNVQISNNTTVNYNQGANTVRVVLNNLTIDSGSKLDMEDANQPLTVQGDINNAGTLELSTASGGDLNANGDWTNSGTFTHSSRQVTFGSSSDQTITNSSGETFAFLELSKTGGNLLLANNISIVNRLQSAVNNTADISTSNSSTCTFTTDGGQLVNNSANNLNLSAIDIFNSGTVTASGTGTLTFQNVTSSDGFNFGSNATLNGTLTINNGGFVDTNAPTFGSSAILNYNSGGTYGQSAEWPSSNGPNNVTLSNSTTVNLAGDRTLTGTLTLTSGLVNLGSNTLTIGTAGSISGTFSASNMIVASGNGYLRKLFSANGGFTFPIGDNTSTAEYSPVIIANLSATYGGSAYLQAKVTDAKHPNNSSVTDFLSRYWTVESNDLTLTSYDIEVFYNESGDVNGTEANMVLGKYNGSTWANVGTVTAGSDKLGATALTSLSDFTGGESSALPIELLSFNAQLEEDGILLNWTTQSEYNNDYFDIQRSSDGNIWEVIGTVQGSGTSLVPISYNYLDRNAIANKNYYRLIQIDFDGKSSFSNILLVEKNAFGKLSFYPNPVQDELFIETDFALANILILNSNGQIVHQALANNKKVVLRIDHLPEGIYFLQIVDENGNAIGTERFLKK